MLEHPYIEDGTNADSMDKWPQSAKNFREVNDQKSVPPFVLVSLDAFLPSSVPMHSVIIRIFREVDYLTNFEMIFLSLSVGLQ